MKRLYFMATIAMLISVSACAGNGVAPSPTVTLDLFAQNAYAQATLDAANTQIAVVNAEAASIAARLTATAEAPTVPAQQTEHALRIAQTEQAMALAKDNATSTASAAQTGTTVAFAGLTATVAANQTETTVANANATGTAIPLQTAQARQEQRAEMALQADAATNVLKTWAPWVIGLAVLVVIGIVIWKLLPVLELRLRTIRRGPHDAPLILLDPGHQTTVIDPDRSFGPALLSGPSGVQVAGQAADPGLQDRVTARDQAVDLARALPPGQRRTFQQLTATTHQPPAQPIEGEVLEADIVVLPPDHPNVQPIVQEVEAKLLTQGGQ